jgi:hypothetical protein
MLLFRFVGSLLFRFAERQFLGLLFQEPPRNTRFDPDDDGQAPLKHMPTTLLPDQPFVKGIHPHKLEPPEHGWPNIRKDLPARPYCMLEPMHPSLEPLAILAQYPDRVRPIPKPQKRDAFATTMNAALCRVRQ